MVNIVNTIIGHADERDALFKMMRYLLLALFYSSNNAMSFLIVKY